MTGRSDRVAVPAPSTSTSTSRHHRRPARPQAHTARQDEAIAGLADLERITSPGAPLADDVRRELEPILGHDLSAIRIHADERSAELAAAVDAEAFTVRDHVWFASGRYEPGSLPGRRLLVHELVHATDAAGSPAAGLLAVRHVDDTSEVLAERVADDTATGHADATERPITGAAQTLGAPTMGRRPNPVGSRSRPAKLSIGEALFGLVERFVRRDPDDRGGRLRSMMSRLAEPVRNAVLGKVEERRGGSLWERLTETLRDPTPASADGGTTHIEVDEPVEESDTAVPESAGDSQTEVEPVESDQQTAVVAQPVEEPVVPAGEKPVDPPTVEPAGEEAEEGPAPTELEATSAETDESGGAAVPAAGGDVVAGEAPAGGGPPVAAPAVAAPEAAPGPAAEEETAEALAPAVEGSDESAEEEPAPEEAEEPEEAVQTDVDAPGPEPEPPGIDDDLDSSAPPPEIDSPSASLSGDAGAPESAPDEAPAAQPAEAEPEAPETQATSGVETVEAVDADPDTAPVDDEAPLTQAEPGGGAEAAEVGAEAPGGEAGCAAAAPAPMQDAPDDGGGGGCGGGGGEAEAEPPPAAPAPAAGADPAAVLGTVAQLPATATPAAIAASHVAATSSVATLQKELAAAPPTADRPSGVPASRDPSVPPPAPPKPPAGTVPAPATLPPGGAGTTVNPENPPPTPPSPTAALPSPRLGGDTQITEADAARMRDSVDSLPTSDPALHVTAGATPALTLDGDADPTRITDQATAVVTTTTELQSQARTDVMADFGDRDIYPHVPAETLTATIERPAAGGGQSGGENAASGGPDIGQVPPVVIDKLVDEDGADKIQASVADQQSAMVAAKEKRAAGDEAAQADSKLKLDKAVSANATEQGELRRDTARSADTNRQSWADENAGHVTESQSMANDATTAADQKVITARTDSASKAQAEIDTGNRDIVKARTEAEDKATEKRREAKKESDGGGFFSWLGSKVASFFNAIKSAIKSAFDAARALVNKAIKAAQELAVAAIEAGRKAVVAAIEFGGEVLKAAGDVVLAGFPEAREKWRATIDNGVSAAKDKVNELADELKAAAVAILDALGKALNALLDVLEAGLLLAVSVVEGVVKGIIAAAKAIADVFGDFLVIAAHVASGPVAWLGRLGGGVVDGFKNCAWPALKAAVKRWFREKVEEVVGVGKVIMDVLVKGCITFAAVAKMAWAAIKESLPGIIISLLIEKVAALLIPALGGLKLIIDGLRAAWGAAQRILQAFRTFIAFLKSVKSGNPAAMFGSLVGAVAVAVLDFVANFVLVKLKGAGQKVGGTLRSMADKIMKGLKKVGGAAKKTAGSVVKGAKAAGAKVVAGAKGAATKAGKALAKTKVVKAVTSAAKGLARGAKKVAAKGKQWIDKRKQKRAKEPKKKETRQQRIDRAIRKTRTAVEALLSKGVSRIRLALTLARLRRKHHWKTLERRQATTGRFKVHGTINPPVELAEGGEVLTVVAQTAQERPAPPWVSDTGRTTGPLPGKQPRNVEYEQRAGVPQILGERFPERKLKVTFAGARTSGGRSTYKEARLNWQMQMKGGDVTGGERRPEGRAVLPVVNPQTGAKSDEVHIFEVTLLTSFIETRTAVGRSGESAKEHKTSQIHWTLSQAQSQFPNASLIHYTIVAPERPDAPTIAHIEDELRAINARQPPRVQISWRIVRTP